MDLLIFSVLVCILASLEASAMASIATDKEALMSFKSGAGLPPSFWDPNSSPCNWTGVVCNQIGQTQRVVALDLSGMGLTGSIAPQIVQLSQLTSLNLSSNAIQGPLPSNMTQLASLQTLDLSSNNITGLLPKTLSHLKKLRVLNLARNKLSGPIPPSISNLSATLTNLNLGTNSLNGVIPSELGSLQKLKELDLAGNQLNGTVALSIYNISSLVRFTVASNQLWGEIPSNIGDTLPNLLYFRNCFNFFTGKIPASLHNISKIRELRLSNNFHEGLVPPGLGNLPFLEMYNIGFNRMESYGEDGLSFITSLTNSTRLQFLAIDDNRLEGVIPESIGNLSKVMQKLYMGGNRFSGNIPSSIGQLSSLTLLNISYNLISGEIPPEIGQLEELQLLALTGNNMSGYVPNSLGNLKKLNTIDLSGNSFVGPIPSSFANFQKLLSMDLSDNLLNGSISREILDLPSLSKILNLSHNHLNGPLPQEIGSLASVVTIDLSNNRFTGLIPSSIGKCTSLEELFMARNTFSGPLPNALGDLRGLEILDLSSNQLSGSIPNELGQLQGLRYLNMSFNQMEGAIPNGGLFVRNISSVHLEGNSKLCLPWPCVKKGGGGHRRKILVPILIVTSILGTMACIGLVGCFLYVRNKKGSKEKLTKTGSLLFVKGQPQMVSYEELREATGSFSPGNLIGSGSFGSVYKGRLREGVEVAVKVLDVTVRGSWKSFVAECGALKGVRHRNLVKVITSCSSLDFKNMEFLALVYEYLSSGSLEDWIKGRKRNGDGDGLNIVERLSIAIDVACGLDYLHHDCAVPVAHCDLKPSNILLDGDLNAKIGDFGLAKLLIERTGNNNSTDVLKGSIGYMPPEYGFGQRPSTAGDAYSFGVVLLELFTGKSPTDESFSGNQNIIRWVQSGFPHNLIKVVDSEMLELIPNISNNNIEEGPSQYMIPEAERNCLISVIEVGLSCTCDSPDGRMSLRDALHKLQTARQTLFKHTHFESHKD